MDDDDIICNILSAMLESLGYEAVFTHDGQEALDQYAQAQQSGRPFDAVIMDLIVPSGMGGREAMANILKLDPNAKGIVSSGYSNSSVMTDYETYGFSAALPKPYRFFELSKTLTTILQK